MNKKKICIIGLGYVGLPLFVSFKKKYLNVCGYDVDKKRVLELSKGYDCNNEIKKKDLLLNNKSFLTSRIKDLEKHNIYIFALPTPINNKKIPDIRILTDATKKVSSILKVGDVIIYESTVYPGLTDEVLIPIIEKNSGLKLNKDFFCGYSPERINPGDKKNTLENISKIVSGSNKITTNLIFKIYQKIIKAKVYKATTIKHAEAAKIIENVQRDINISFVNELSILFNKLNINTREVLELASTKWNFIKFQPGLVGGHCIGVDPYYLTYKAKQHKYFPRTILSGRKVNDNMSNYVSNFFYNSLKEKNKIVLNLKVLILGFSFKENCSDFRNTQVIKVYKNLCKKKLKVDIYDPLVDRNKVYFKYNINILKKITRKYDDVIICVAHNIFKKLFSQNNIKKFLNKKHIIYDMKWLLKKNKNILNL